MTQYAHRIVIVGGGAGGLELAARLGRQLQPRNVVLIDAASAHIWKPSLHEVAAGTLDVHREGLSYFALAKQCGFTFVHGSMVGVDRARQRVLLAPLLSANGEQIFPERALEYDSLVLAIGSNANFFNTPGAEEHAIALDSTAQAEYFRVALLRELAALHLRKQTAAHVNAPAPDSALALSSAIEVSSSSLSPDEVLHIAIVGGGATGVELAAELVEALKGLAYYGIDELKPDRDVKITLIEGANRILSALPEKVSIKAHKLLQERGVAIRTGIRVTQVNRDSLVDDNGQRHVAHLCVWAAGIMAPPVLSELGLQTNRINQLVVDDHLRTLDPHIFALGDCAEAPWYGESKALPAKAQVAHQQAIYLQKVLRARVTGRSQPEQPFRFRDYGSLVSVGHAEGVGSLMGVLSDKNLFVEGMLARFMYMSLHLRHHMAVLGVLQTAALAVGRLLLRRSTPRVKLH